MWLNEVFIAINIKVTIDGGTSVDICIIINSRPSVTINRVCIKPPIIRL